MPVVTMLPVVTIVRLIRHYRARRAEHRSRLLIEALPRYIQKDIGWPDPVRPAIGGRSRETWPS